MGIDRPDDADVPSDEHSGHSAERSGGPVETRYRQEYYGDLRAAVAVGTHAGTRKTADPQNAAAPSNANGDADGKPWDDIKGWSHRVWAEYQYKWPPEERAPVDRSEDPPGSWRGDGNQFLDKAANGRVEQWCGLNERGERDTVSPKMRAMESADPERCLIGFEYRLKGHDRIKEKVAQYMDAKGSTADVALSTVKDAIRYTFMYNEDRYADGVRADLDRIADKGFEQVKLRNSWASDQYKGINSWWREPSTGLLFEVQFHTKVSFEAKQVTHGAYERLRSGQASEFEDMALEAFQKKVFGAASIPPGATDIPDYPEEG